MKPRTKLQLRVAGLSSQLPNIESLMIDWAKNECLKHIGYATNHVLSVWSAANASLRNL